jgi:hypothetical protein
MQLGLTRSLCHRLAAVRRSGPIRRVPPLHPTKERADNGQNANSMDTAIANFRVRDKCALDVQTLNSTWA